MAQVTQGEGLGRALLQVKQLLERRASVRILLLAVVAGMVVACYLGSLGASKTSFSLEQIAATDERDADDSLDEVDTESEQLEEQEAACVVVDVGGAVLEPGVVELASGSRVADAIDAAGGLAQDADCTSLNRAQLLQDGQKVYVPREGESAAPSGGEAVTTGAQQGAALVNINTASLEELDALPGVGPATAQAIVDDRDQNGPFTTPEDLMRVSGIGEKKYANLESLICI